MAHTSLTRARTHGGNPWQLMREQKLPKAQVLDFSIDVNPLGFPASIRSVILDHVDDIQCYPDPDAWELREAIAAYHRIPIEAILPGNGAAELIGLLARVRRVNRALIVVPTFSEYEWATDQVGATTVLVETTEANGFRLEMARQAWPEGFGDADLIFLCNPNNPTGTVAPKADVLELAHRCLEAGALLVVDESFVEFLPDPEDASVLSEAIPLGRVAVLRSLTKSFAIPGLRLGYLVASPSLVEPLRALQPAWPLNTFALAVGAQLFKEREYLARSQRAIAEFRDELQQALSALPGLHPYTSTTNFLLCKLTSPKLTSAALAERLAGQGILIRNCDSFTGLEPGRFIRVAVRMPEDNARLIEVLREALADAG